MPSVMKIERKRNHRIIRTSRNTQKTCDTLIYIKDNLDFTFFIFIHISPAFNQLPPTNWCACVCRKIQGGKLGPIFFIPRISTIYWFTGTHKYVKLNMMTIKKKKSDTNFICI